MKYKLEFPGVAFCPNKILKVNGKKGTGYNTLHLQNRENKLPPR